MSEGPLPDYLDHMRKAASDACRFVDGTSKEDFLDDKCTHQLVVMSLFIIGEAASKVMDRFAEFADQNPEIPWPRASDEVATAFE
jgi:uncharacterized protein with HEPN domain